MKQARSRTPAQAAKKAHLCSRAEAAINAAAPISSTPQGRARSNGSASAPADPANSARQIRQRTTQTLSGIALIPQQPHDCPRVIRILNRKRRKRRNLARAAPRIAQRKIPPQRTSDQPSAAMVLAQAKVPARSPQAQKDAHAAGASRSRSNLACDACVSAPPSSPSLTEHTEAADAPNSRFQNQLPRILHHAQEIPSASSRALDNVPKRSFQRTNIEKTTQPNASGIVCTRHDRLPAVQKHSRRCANDNGTSEGRNTERSGARRNTAIPKPTNKQSYRRRFKQAADRTSTQGSTDPADQTCRQKRVTPSAKKSSSIQLPQPQHLRKKPAQNLPHAACAPTESPHPDHRRRRKRCTVKLPVRRQRKTIKLNNRAGTMYSGSRDPTSAQIPSINRTTSRATT